MVKRQKRILIAVLTAVFLMLPAGTVKAEHHDYTADEILDTLEDVFEWQKDVCGYDELFNKNFLKNAGTSVNDWFAFAAVRSGYEADYASYRFALESSVAEKYAEEEKKLEKATEWHREALLIAAMGGDPREVPDESRTGTIDLIADGIYNRADTEPLDTQGTNALIWALITLDSNDYEIPKDAAEDREDILEQLLTAQEEDGGFSLSANSGMSDPDITAMALNALAPYRDTSEKVQKAIERALAWLSRKQKEDGGFVSSMEEGDGSAESCAQVLTALCSLGIDMGNDSRFIKNGNTVLDALMSFRQKDGGFVHSYTYDKENPTAKPDESNLMASGQTAYALTALCRYYGNMRTLFDLRKEKGGEAAVSLFGAELSAAIVFSDQDKKAAEMLPEDITTEYGAQVAGLLGKLRAAQNRSDYTDTEQLLETKQQQIQKIHSEINRINKEIVENLYPLESLGKEDEPVAADIEKRIAALSDYDRAQITAYEDVQTALTRLENRKTAQMIKIAAAAVLAILVLFVLWRIRRRGAKKREERRMEESGGTWDDDEEDDEW